MHTNANTFKTKMPFMGWSHHMRRPNTFDCSKVRNSEKFIMEIKTIHTLNGPATGLQLLYVIKFKECFISCHVYGSRGTTIVTFMLYNVYHSFSFRGLILPDECQLLLICLCLWFICLAAKETYVPKIIQKNI